MRIRELKLGEIIRDGDEYWDEFLCLWESCPSIWFNKSVIEGYRVRRVWGDWEVAEIAKIFDQKIDEAKEKNQPWRAALSEAYLSTIAAISDIASQIYDQKYNENLSHENQKESEE